MISIVPYVFWMNLAAQYLYPTYATFRTITMPYDTPHKGRYWAQWTTYWILCAVWVTLDYHLFVYIEDYIPLFQEAKLLVLCWMIHPSFHGAAYLWFGHVKKHHQKFLDGGHHDKFLGFLGPLGKETQHEEKKEEKAFKKEEVRNAKEDVKMAKEELKMEKEAHAGKQEIAAVEEKVREAVEAEEEAEEDE